MEYWISPFLIGTTSSKGPFSIAMLDYRSVSLIEPCTYPWMIETKHIISIAGLHLENAQSKECWKVNFFCKRLQGRKWHCQGSFFLDPTLQLSKFPSRRRRHLEKWYSHKPLWRSSFGSKYEVQTGQIGLHYMFLRFCGAGWHTQKMVQKPAMFDNHVFIVFVLAVFQMQQLVPIIKSSFDRLKGCTGIYNDQEFDRLWRKNKASSTPNVSIGPSISTQIFDLEFSLQCFQLFTN